MKSSETAVRLSPGVLSAAAQQPSLSYGLQTVRLVVAWVLKMGLSTIYKPFGKRADVNPTGSRESRERSLEQRQAGSRSGVTCTRTQGAAPHRGEVLVRPECERGSEVSAKDKTLHTLYCPRHSGVLLWRSLGPVVLLNSDLRASCCPDEEGVAAAKMRLDRGTRDLQHLLDLPATSHQQFQPAVKNQMRWACRSRPQRTSHT